MGAHSYAASWSSRERDSGHGRMNPGVQERGRRGLPPRSRGRITPAGSAPQGPRSHATGSHLRGSHYFMEPTMSTWNLERTARLQLLWSGGYSASEIARVLGGLTRNAVIGKIHRLKLRSPGRARARRASRKASRQPRSRFFIRPIVRRTPKPFIEIPPLAAPPTCRIELKDLRRSHCRWPQGDPRKPDFHFCGRPAGRGQTYCPHHRAHAYVQPRTSRTRRRSKLAKEQLWEQSSAYPQHRGFS
jgi:GcrA cell cycle regulator